MEGFKVEKTLKQSLLDIKCVELKKSWSETSLVYHDSNIFMISLLSVLCKESCDTNA